MHAGNDSSGMHLNCGVCNSPGERIQLLAAMLHTTPACSSRPRMHTHAWCVLNERSKRRSGPVPAKASDTSVLWSSDAAVAATRLLSPILPRSCVCTFGPQRR